MNENISIIIISYNSKEYVIDCIKSIIYTCYDFIPEIIVVDNNSSDNSVEVVEKLFPDVVLVKNKENYGYAKAINIGVENATGDFLILSNADVIYRKDSIQTLVNHVVANTNSICGPQQIFPDGKFQRSFGYFPSIKRAIYDVFGFTKFVQIRKKNGFEKGIHKPYEVEYIDGAILCTNRYIFNYLKGFDEDYFFYSEEVDFCYKAQMKEIECTIVPGSVVVHHRGGSQENKGMSYKSIEMLIKAEKMFLKKHKSEFESNAYFTLELIYFKLLTLLYSLSGRKEKSENCKLYVKAIKNR
ncbi:MAG: glycosyltransferase family 2 protein [Chlorobiota bacterium]